MPREKGPAVTSGAQPKSNPTLGEGVNSAAEAVANFYALDELDAPRQPEVMRRVNALRRAAQERQP